MPGKHHSGHGHGHDRKQDRKRANKRHAAIALLLAAAAVVAGMILFRLVDGQELKYDDETLARESALLSDVVDVGGVRCVPKKNIRTYLIMGIDNTASRGRTYVTGGQSDVLVLLVVDHTNMTYQRLPINRNTMCQVRSYDIDGNDLGTAVTQIALAHAVGDGGAQSCENAVEAVSTLLYGMPVDSYIALDMESIGVVNHLAGGVTVTIEDDFSQTDPSLVMGETVTLTDEQAETFVRARMSMANDDTNEARMRRQQAFMDAMREQMFERARADSTYALDVFDTLEPHMVTNMNGKAFSRLVNGLTNCESLGTLQIDGTIGTDSLGYATFEPDPASVRDAVIALYYRPADE